MRHSVLTVLLIALLPAAAWAQKQPFPIKGGLKVVPGALRNPNVIDIPRLSFTKQLKEEHIQLKDGDIFRGKFSQYILSQGIHWKHPHIRPQLIINPEHVKHIQFEAEKTKEALKSHSTKITLFSGDEFSGDLQRMSKGKLIINTWYAGRIEIEQSALKSMIPGFMALKMIYEGPINVNDWSFYDPSSGQIFKELDEAAKKEEIESKEKKINLAQGTWKLKNGIFETHTSQSRVGRRFKELPDKMQFDFDLDWSSYLNLYINFLSDRLDSYSTGNSYCLRLNTSYAYLYKYSRKNGIGAGRSMGSNVRVNLTSLGNHARISIRADRKKNIIALYINDKFLKKWEDVQKGGLPADAKGLLFTSMSSNLIELSRITVSEWSGKLPDGNKATMQNGPEDFVLFANEDTMTGKLIGIEDGKIQFKTAFADLPIPLRTITRINMAHKNNEPTTKKGIVKVILHNGQGQISGSIQSWQNGKIILSSPYFSDTSFSQKAFERIEFEN